MDTQTMACVYSLNELRDAYSRGHKFNFVFFAAFDETDIKNCSSKEGCLSLYFPIQFTDQNGSKYSSIYQYIMSQKALLFKDQEIYNKIMKSTDASEMKKLGRQIKNFNQDKWNESVDEIVYQGNLYKFDQNKELKEVLLNFPPDSIFVYASHENEMYGIQINSDDPKANDPLKWGGYNKLGFQITKVRDTFLNKLPTLHLQENANGQISTENIYTLQGLKESLSKGARYEFINFYDFSKKDVKFDHLTNGCFSHFFPIEFCDKRGVKYSNCYQFMMAQKALFFNDHKIFNQIMKTDDHFEQKKLGRKVTNFDLNLWKEVSDDLCYEGNLYKFSQNEKLYEFILSFNANSLFVNCDPNDEMYGIQLTMDDQKAKNPNEWKGFNKLGFQLTRVRHTLMKATSNFRLISYAYDDFVTNIYRSEKVESLDLISSGVTQVNLSDYPNLKRLRISKCRALQEVQIKNMPKLEVVDLLNNKKLHSVTFKKCPKLITLDVGFCYSLKKLHGATSLKYLSAPCCGKLDSLQISNDLVYFDMTDTPISMKKIINDEKNIECLVCSCAEVRLSEITKNESIKIIHLESSKLICDSNSSKKTNLRILILGKSTCEGKTDLLDQFYVTNCDNSNKKELLEFSPEYQQYQRMLYGPWGIPKVDLIPPSFVSKPCILPPSKVNQQRAADAILGSLFASAVMDMVGVGVEFISKEIARPLLLGDLNISWTHPRCNPHNERFVRGTPTDDTSQSILIMRSIVDTNTRPYNSPSLIDFEGVKIDPCDFGRRLVEWMNKGHYEHKHSGGLGIGSTTLKVVENKLFNSDPIAASKDTWIKSGRKVAPNGSVMRIASSGCFAFWNENIVIKIADVFGKVTHYDPRCVFSAISAALLIARYIQWNSGLLDSEPDIDHTLNDAWNLVPDIDQYKEDVQFYITCKTVEQLELSGNAKIGYCLKALGSGIWALRYCSSIEQGLVEVIRQGGDSDTNGAVVGALLGAKYGFNSIPREFIDLMFVGQWMYKEIEPYMKLMGIEVPQSPFLK